MLYYFMTLLLYFYQNYIQNTIYLDTEYFMIMRSTCLHMLQRNVVHCLPKIVEKGVYLFTTVQ